VLVDKRLVLVTPVVLANININSNVAAVGLIKMLAAAVTDLASAVRDNRTIKINSIISIIRKIKWDAEVDTEVVAAWSEVACAAEVVNHSKAGIVLSKISISISTSAAAVVRMAVEAAATTHVAVVEAVILGAMVKSNASSTMVTTISRRPTNNFKKR